MSIDAIYVVKEFYALEALNYLVNKKSEFGRHSHDRLIKDIDEFRDRFVTNLSIALLDYTAMVIYGEMRHGWEKSTHYNPNVSQCDRRSDSYSESKKYNPISILEAGKALFAKSSWEDNYGGEKWFFIADRVLLKANLDKFVFSDMCFSLSHNSSPYLDKYQSGIFKISCTSDYKNFLDFKFNCSNPFEIIYENYPSYGRRLQSLIRRAIKLGLINYFCGSNYYTNGTYNEEAEEYIYNYSPEKWGKDILPNEVILHRHILDDPSGYELPENRDKFKKIEFIQSKVESRKSSDVKFKVGQTVKMKYDYLDDREIKEGMEFVITRVVVYGDNSIYYNAEFDTYFGTYYEIPQEYLEEIMEENTNVEEKEAC